MHVQTAVHVLQNALLKQLLKKAMFMRLIRKNVSIAARAKAFALLMRSLRVDIS
jgi:hypothetical protein